MPEEKGLSPHFAPPQGICEFLTALHAYVDEARRGEVRVIEANHYCTHYSSELRQCLIYDSPKKGARLIGVEYMIPKRVYQTLDPEEQKLWHSHDYEVKSGMLILPKPEGTPLEEWEKAELEGMKEVIGLYGKTWHFWQVDRGDKLPIGMPRLMGSLIQEGQVDLDVVLKSRNEVHGVHHDDKKQRREDIPNHDIHPNADLWWKEGRAKK